MILVPLYPQQVAWGATSIYAMHFSGGEKHKEKGLGKSLFHRVFTEV